MNDRCTSDGKTAMSKPNRLSGNALAMGSMILWSTSFPATDEILQTWHPLVTAMGRLVIGGLALLPFMWWQGNLSDVMHAPWKKLLIVGGIPLSIATVCLNVGMMYSNPVTAAILVTMMPPIAFLLAVVDGEQRVTLKWTFGIALAVTGGVWASVYGDLDDIGFQGGEILLVVAVTCFAWYSRATVKHMKMLSTASITALTLIAGGLIACVIIVTAHLVGLVNLYYVPTPRSVGLMVWIAAISNGCGMLMWLSAVSRIGVTISAFHQNMVPFYVMVMAVALGGLIVMQQVFGALLVIGGVLITQWPFREKQLD